MSDTIRVEAKLDDETDGRKLGWARGVAVRLADEGVPVGAIVRSVRQPYDVVRPMLRDAQNKGVILSIPRDDWPPGTRRSERIPDVVPVEVASEQLITTIMRVFHLTRAQATVFGALLRRSEMTKGALHMCVQREGAEPTDRKIVDVLVCHLRKRLPEVIKIETIWGRGYFISLASKKIAYEKMGLGAGADGGEQQAA